MMRKFGISVAALFLVIQCHAVNYYFAANGSDSYTSTQAQSKTTPWLSITKLNSFFVNIKPGDSILFRCGDTFTGTITPTVSGTAAKPIIISWYGTGAKPIISGLVPVTGWVSLGGGIVQGSCPLAGATVNTVLWNGVTQQIGRYPNANMPNGGFLNIDSHTGDTQIVSSALNTAINWAGAEVVIRKNHWIIDRGTIGSNTATVINYTDASAYQPTNNFGFFIQNNPNTLDQVGEWYFNPTAKTIMLYTGGAIPANTEVKVSSTAYLISINSVNYITIDGLTFIGANTHLININTSINCTIRNSKFTAAGCGGIVAVTTTNLNVTNCVLSDNNDIGIKTTNATASNIVADTIKNIGVRAGMGQSGDGHYEGIIQNGPKALIANSVISNIGYDGIDFARGDSTVIKNNLITQCQLVKEDGGAIYTNGGDLDSLHNRYGIQIINNIITNTHGAPNGASGVSPAYGCGIYMDANATGITIGNNTFSGNGVGVFVHDSRNITITGNTFFNNTWQIYFFHNETTYTVKNNITTNNIIYAEYSNQYTLNMQTINTGVGTFSTFSNNYYSPPIDNVFPFFIAGKFLNLQLWQYLYSKDLTSTNTPSIPFYSVVMPSKRNQFANGPFNTNINTVTAWSANGNFLATWDNTGTMDGGSLKTYFTLQSNSPTNNPMMQFKVGNVTAGQVYMIRFSMKSTHGHRRLMISLMNAVSPYNSLSITKYILLDSVRTENTIYIVPTGSSTNSVCNLRLENEDVTNWIDNFSFLPTTSTPVDPNTQIFFQYNDSPAPLNTHLASSYIDSKNVTYNGSVTIPPYSSVLLFKNADSAATQPPVIYSAPNASKDIVAFASIPKTANIGVYPNPATDYIMLNFNNSDVRDLNIQLYNTNGDVVLNQNVSVDSGSYRLDFSQKPKPGCYFMKLSGSGVNQTSKVVIM